MNENLKMSAALVSRFDLVFILLDKPDELLDKRVSEHIMSVSCTALSSSMVFASKYIAWCSYFTFIGIISTLFLKKDIFINIPGLSFSGIRDMTSQMLCED